MKKLIILKLLFLPLFLNAQLYWEDNFSSSNWKKNYDMNAPKNFAHISNGGPGGNGCVEITIKKGTHLGGAARYMLKEKLGFEPEELYAEYKVRYDGDMKEYGGKGPGFSGTYDRSGWGNRPGYGRAGWSARGGVNCDNQPYAKNSWYVYHTYTNYDAPNCPGSTDYRKCNPFPHTVSNPGSQPHASKKTWGSGLNWGNKGNMQFNRWYSVKQYIKLNTPGKNNGILKVWIDGQLANQYTNMNFRRTSDLKIYAYWFNYYNGGSNTIRETGHVRIDDFKLYGPNGQGGGGGGNGGGNTVSVTGVSISDSNVILNVNQTRDLNATVTPSNAADKSVTWSSNNTSVARVNSSGLVTAVSQGSATITVTTKDGNKKATSRITVRGTTPPPPPPSGSDIVIEAEDFINTGGTFNDASAGGPGLGMNANGIGVNYVNNGDWSEYTINVGTSGNYSITYQISTPSDNAQVQLLIDGKIVATDNVRNNGNWDNYTALVSSSTIANLSSGRHTVRVVASGSNPWQWNLDKIILKRISGNNGGSGQSATATLSPIHDVYLENSNRKNINLIRIEKGKREGYFLFDTSSINGKITSAQLELTCTSDAGNGSIEIKQGNSVNWTETNLSNSNKPSGNSTLGSLNESYKLNTTYKWDLKNINNKGNKLCLIVTQKNGNDVAFASKENANSIPKLKITYTKGTRDNDLNFDNRKSFVYPNPFSDTFTINLSGQDYNTIRVVDIHGKIIRDNAISPDAKIQNESLFINLQNVPTGMYFIELLGSSEKEILKIFKK
ncbi:Ig-like domain-containing protein [Aquimarina sp. RZ0]|uniref:Ig-like domain-containing protein n=1 Tax=Aquimarina sp. RZ0 TaxID=2607730 RepID=UPI0011F32AB1|nr:Ig-like domain-containing protein [Aquimarina sp. RZ0]KAA1247926.1 carbohydrate-binding protein [Aquimarina sp. RZ0]